MKWGLAGAILWAFDTVIIGVVLSTLARVSPEHAIVLAPLVSTFLHDAIIALYETIRMGQQGRFSVLARMLRGKVGAYVLLGSFVGCPLANAGNVIAVGQIGPSYAAMITAFYPAVGALLARIFLGERMRWYQWIALVVCMVCVAALGFNPDDRVSGNWILGVASALVAVAGWAIQAVFITYALRLGEVDGKTCLQVRFTLSVLTYALVVFPALDAWDYVAFVATSDVMPLIAIAAVAGAAALACYYIALEKIGATKAMAIDITYAAWAVPLELLLLGRMPTVFGVCCAVVMVAGSIVAASDMKELLNHEE